MFFRTNLSQMKRGMTISLLLISGLILAACGAPAVDPPAVDPPDTAENGGVEPPQPTTTTGPDFDDEVIAECFFDIDVYVWADIDADGEPDPDEPPLEGIKLDMIVDADGRQYASTYTVYDGRGALSGIVADDCIFDRFSAVVYPPQGFTPTTPDSVNLANYQASVDVVRFGLQPPADFVIPTAAPDDLACAPHREEGPLWLDLAPNGELVGIDNSLFYGERSLARWTSNSVLDEGYLTQSGAVWAVPATRTSGGYTPDGSAWDIFDGDWLAFLTPARTTSADGMLWFTDTRRNDVIVLGYHPETSAVVALTSRWQGADGPERLIVARYNGDYFATLLDDPAIELPDSAPDGWELLEARVIDEVDGMPRTIDQQGGMAVAGGSDGILWIGARSALFRYDANRNAWLDVTPEVGTFNRVEALTVAPDGTVWIVSRVERWTLMRYREGAWQQMRGGYDDELLVYAMAASDEALYLSTSEGSITRCEVLAE